MRANQRLTFVPTYDEQALVPTGRFASISASRQNELLEARIVVSVFIILQTDIIACILASRQNELLESRIVVSRFRIFEFRLELSHYRRKFLLASGCLRCDSFESSLSTPPVEGKCMFAPSRSQQLTFPGNFGP